MTSEKVVSGSHETMLDTKPAQWHSTQATPSPVVNNETGIMNTSASRGDVVKEPSGVRPPVHLPSSVNSGIGTAIGTVGTAIAQASHAGGVKPPPGLPPGFSTPDGTPPPLMGGSMPQSPPMNMSPAGIFQGHPIVMGTPPRHQSGMISPHSGQLVGSPIQRELWLRHQGGVMLSPYSPPMRPLVPYPLSPELHQLQPQQQWRGPSENLPVDPHGSPVRGHQRLAEHNHQMLPQSPPNISRTVMWPVAPNSPHHNLGSFPDPAMVREQHFPLPGHRSPFPGNSSPSVAPQQTQFPRGTPPGPAVGSPQQMPPLPHQGAPLQPAIGAHMVSPPYWPYWFYYY